MQLSARKNGNGFERLMGKYCDIRNYNSKNVNLVIKAANLPVKVTRGRGNFAISIDLDKLPVELIEQIKKRLTQEEIDNNYTLIESFLRAGQEPIFQDDDHIAYPDASILSSQDREQVLQWQQRIVNLEEKDPNFAAIVSTVQSDINGLIRHTDGPYHERDQQMR